MCNRQISAIIEGNIVDTLLSSQLRIFVTVAHFFRVARHKHVQGTSHPVGMPVGDYVRVVSSLDVHHYTDGSVDPQRHRTGQVAICVSGGTQRQ